eukprot:1150725-Pelagomonas_calceolata.AAC.2
MSGQERPARPRLASLSPGKALTLDSLPHGTQRGAVSFGYHENPAMQGQHMQGQQLPPGQQW